MSGDWNLEASTDGTTWDVIHEARGKQSKLYGGVNDNNEFYQNYEEEYKECMDIWNMAQKCGDMESRKKAVSDYMEENHRLLWQVNNTAGKFYTHFRFVSIEIHAEQWSTRLHCLHGMGFEVYGDVNEEWSDESNSRIEQLEERVEKQQAQITNLEDRNKALLSENDSLKARIRQLESKRGAEEACLSEK